MATAFCSFGYQNFRADFTQIYTPNSISLKHGKQTETQGTKGKKPVSYISEIDLATISFKIHLTRRLGVGVEGITDAWIIMSENNIPYAFVIGGRYMGKFLCKSVDVEIKEMNKKGVIVTAVLSVTLEEYKGQSARVGVLSKAVEDYDT